MKPKVMIVVAIILIVLGVVALAYHGITYKTQENVVELGPLHVTAEKTKTLPLPPILGVVALTGGIILLVVAAVKKR